MSAPIPYVTAARPDTGLTNGALGLWLFLASETMLFGSLFSAYAILRTGATAWPTQPAFVHLSSGILATVVLAAASAALVAAQRALRTGRLARVRFATVIACAGGVGFLAVKFVDYSANTAAGFVPATNNFAGLYYVLTGLHALHVLGGVVVAGYLAGPGAVVWRTEPQRYAGRLRLTATYWYFVDAIWLALFAILYLG